MDTAAVSNSPLASEHKGIAAQCLVEHEILQHVKAALRLSMNLDASAVGLSRKLASVRFTLGSLRRHLERLMSLEEDGGYMVIVDELKPHLVEKAAALRQEHDDFRRIMQSVVAPLERMAADDQAGFDRSCGQLSSLLEKIDRHDHKEVALLHEVSSCDEGGEG